MITYKINSLGNIDVILYGKKVGSILKISNGVKIIGYAYQPKGTTGSHQGDTYNTIEQVKKSIEDE